MVNFCAPGWGYKKYIEAHATSQTKGIFPLAYLDCIEKLAEPIPACDKFKNTLKGEDLSEEDEF